MEEKKKLKYFYDSTISSIKKQSEQDQEKLRVKLEKELEKYKKEFTLDSEVQERLHMDKITHEMQKRQSSTKLKLRREESRAEGIIKDKLFEEVTDILREFRKTPEYKSLLIHMIEKTLKFADDDEVIISINEEDAHLKEELEAATGVNINVSDIPFKGGIQADIPSRNIFINNSFHSQVERMKEQYIVRP